MFKIIRRAVCSHNFSWSERRKGEVCNRCGRFREVTTDLTVKGPFDGH